MSEKYLEATEDGSHVDENVVCLACGWRGYESALKIVQYYPEDDYTIVGETHRVCPECESPAWEPQ